MVKVAIVTTWDFVESFVKWWHFCDVFPHIVWCSVFHTFCFTRKKSNGVTDFHGNRYNSISFVLWSWNRQRIVSLNNNYGFEKTWVIWHVVMYVQLLLSQATFASRKKNTWFLSENEIRGRKVANGRIYWADASIWKDKSMNISLSPTFPNWIPDLQLLLLC